MAPTTADRWRRRIGWCAAVAVALLVISTPGGHAATSDWEAEHFVIYGDEPLSRPIGELTAEAAALGRDRASSQVARQREGDLERIAARYRRADLRSPMLDPVETLDSGEKAYGVFLFDFRGGFMDAFRSNGGIYEAVPEQTRSAGCEPITSGWLALNAAQSPSRDGFFLTLAHELFHGVQAAYPFKRGCRVVDWINEGMAKAVEQHVFAAENGGTEWGVYAGNRSSMGLRPYHIPLHYEAALDGTEDRVFTGRLNQGRMDLRRKDVGYGTASFWRFLMEAGDGLRTLATIMENGIPHDSPKGRIRWLNDGIRDESRFGDNELYAMYPQFVTEFASWGGKRFDHIAGTVYDDLDAARDRWLTLGFDDCREIELTPGDTESIQVTLERIAAQCIRVTYTDLLVETTPLIEALHGSSADLDGVHLGVAWQEGPGREFNCWPRQGRYDPRGQNCLLKVQHLESSDGRWAREWNDGPIDPGGVQGAFDPGTERLYVLSNVRRRAPWDTRKIEVTFRVGLPAAEIPSGEAAEPPESTTLKESESMQRLAETAGSGDVSQAEAMEAVSELMGQIMSGATPEALYGASGSIGIPVAVTELGSFSFVRADGRRVTLQPMPGADGDDLAFGETGPLLGSVTVEADGNAIDSSMLCESNQARAGEVVESTDDRLVIRIAADICRMDPARPMACADGCPRVDRVDATLKLPAGWRYYATSAPEPVVTEGIEDYIRRFVDMDAPAFVGPRRTDPPDPDDGDDGDGDDGGGVGVARDPDDSADDEPDCDCSCNGYRELMELIEKATSTVPPDLEAVERANDCFDACALEFMRCE